MGYARFLQHTGFIHHPSSLLCDFHCICVDFIHQFFFFFFCEWKDFGVPQSGGSPKREDGRFLVETGSGSLCHHPAAISIRPPDWVSGFSPNCGRKWSTRPTVSQEAQITSVGVSWEGGGERVEGCEQSAQCLKKARRSQRWRRRDEPASRIDPPESRLAWQRSTAPPTCTW